MNFLFWIVLELLTLNKCRTSLLAQIVQSTQADSTTLMSVTLTVNIAPHLSDKNIEINHQHVSRLSLGGSVLFY